MLTDERYKQLMEQVGMPESLSLLQALKQAALEGSIRNAPCERFCEATAFNAEIKRLRGAIRRYCEWNKDMPQYEKDTPVIKELFYISAH